VAVRGNVGVVLSPERDALHMKRVDHLLHRLRVRAGRGAQADDAHARVLAQEPRNARHILMLASRSVALVDHDAHHALSHAQALLEVVV